jgi:serine/threonine protein kinase
VIGESIAQYRIERELATGGFGIVYAATGPAGERVAIKVLLAEHVGSRAVERFEREIAIVKRLAHPGIVAVLATGRLPDGRPYCVMPLLDGHDLGAELERGPVPLERAIAIVAGVSDALAVAHAAHIVHRDIKPTNVFVCADGRVVVLDFGIAKLLADDDAARLTMSRQTVGSQGAMAPEQLAAGAVDERTDVYALGVLAYHVICGEPPFVGDGAAQLHRFARRPRPSARGAPSALDPVITRAMAIRPAERYAGAAEFAEALRAAAGASTRSRIHAIGVYLDALAAPKSLVAANERLASLQLQPLVGAATCAVWWCDAAVCADLVPALRTIAAMGIRVCVHADELETDGGEASDGPLAELWRWVPATSASDLVYSDAARDILGAS